MLTIRSNTCGGGPSIDSKATVGPLALLAVANELLAAPLPAQPASAQAAAKRAADIAPRSAIRWLRNKFADVLPVTPKPISLKCVKV
jgi:hypothetical protein